MRLERLLDDSSLDAAAAPMDEPHFAQAGCMRLDDVYLDDRWDIAGCKGVEIEKCLNRNPQRILV